MNAIEEAQCRVARAQEERDRLHDRVQGEYGSIDTMSMYARNGNAKAADLRRAYNRAAKELRLAKSDLELMRARDIVPEAECKDHGRERELRDDGLMYCCRCGGCLGPEILPAEDEPGESRNVTEGDCKGCMFEHSEDAHECCGCEVDGDEAGNPTHYEPAAPAPWWEGGPLDTVNGMPWHVAVARCPEGSYIILKPGTYTYDSEDGGLIVELFEPHLFGGPAGPIKVLVEILNDHVPTVEEVKGRRPAHNHPSKDIEVKVEKEDLKRFLTRRIAEEEAASAARRQVQLDLELQPVKLPEGIKETERVRRSRVYEHDKFKLTISEDDLANLWAVSSSKARTMIARKLKLLPDEELFPGEWDDEVELLHHELYKLSVQLSKERAAAAMRGEA